MCGIAGWVDWERDLTEERLTANAMNDTMSCRGPDDKGLWLAPRVALGNRRLAVIDITGGRQPMWDLDIAERAVLTYSGEVYNFRELRAELESHGHTFRTRCDTEVVLRSYLQWGDACVTRLNGMFAFAIWDQRLQRLLLARDRFGIKPLYYFTYGTGLLFGSEPKALLVNPLFTPAIDASGLCELFGLNKGRSPGHAVFHGLHELRPGCTLQLDHAGARLQQYWALSSHPHKHDLPTTVRTVRALLEDIVDQNLIADVPVSTLLSGGLDSSVVLALAARTLEANGRRPPATFSVDFENDERYFRPSTQRPTMDAPFARLMAEHVGARHTNVVLTAADLLNQHERTLEARDLPGHGDMDASLYLLCREASKHSTVALSGEGADEVFGGYPWFRNLPPPTLRNFPWRTTIPDIADLLSEEARRSIDLDAYVADRYSQALAEVPYLAGERGADRTIRELSYLTLTRYLPLMLDRKDRLSMAVGLEVRVPFCDHRLLEYVWNIPWSMRTTGAMEKGILRRAVKHLLPPEVLHREKSGFPAIQDPRYDDELSRRLKEWIADTSSPLDPLVDRTRVAALIDDQQMAAVGWRRSRALGKNLLEIDAWMRRFSVRILC